MKPTYTSSYRISGWSLKRIDEIVQEIQSKVDTLQTISMYDMELPDHCPDYYLDSLLQVLCSAPCLECLDSSICTFQGKQHNRPLIKPETLRRFLENAANLVEVTLWNWSLTECHIIKGMIPGLLSLNSNVQFLSLRRNPCISPLAWSRLYDVAEANSGLTYILSDTKFIPSDRQLLYLDLNQRGRGNILERGNQNAVSVLETFSRESLDIFSYFVQQLVPYLLVSNASFDQRTNPIQRLS